MSSWRECKLGEVATYRTGKLNSNAATENGEYPFFTCSPITAKIDNFVFNEEALLLAGNNANGIFSLKYYKGKFNAYQRTYIINTEEDYKFLFYSLKLQLANLMHMSQGTATKFLTLPILNSIDISLPPLEEQKAIAEVLISLDDKIDLLNHQNHTLESLAQTLFRQWFIEEAKEEWEEKPLGEITNIAIGRTPPRKEKEWFSTDSQDVKWISIKDLGNDGAFIFKTSEYLTQEAVERFNVPVIPKDTVVLSFKMTVGRVAITTEAMLSNEAIAHFKFNDKTPISKEYLYLFLKTFPYESLGSTSSIVTAINSTMIKEILILIPDEKAMKDFSSIVEPQFEKIRQNQKQIQTLENLRDTLLPKLLSGEVRVNYGE